MVNSFMYSMNHTVTLSLYFSHIAEKNYKEKHCFRPSQNYVYAGPAGFNR